MKAKALLIALLASATFTAVAAVQTTPAATSQEPSNKQAPIALTAAQMDQIVAGGRGPGTGACTGTGIPKRDGTGPKFGKK